LQKKQIEEDFGLLKTFDTAKKALAENPELANKRPLWKEFRQEIQQLNKDAPANVQYKVFFLARHGQAMHVSICPSYSIIIVKFFSRSF
jgi:hypothetical protein